MELFFDIVQVIAAAAALGGVAYYLFSMWAARQLLEEGFARPGPTPRVSILKPLRGLDRHAYECLRSHCLLDYPEYEIIFGVSDERDPAIGLVKRVAAEFPERNIQLFICPERLGSNGKVSTLVQMLASAQYEHLVISDSDIQVPRDYLRQVMAEFADKDVGVVTCLYRGLPGPTLGSRLEALGISTDFVPGVLAARQLDSGVKFALGSTVALRRDVLEAIGGLEPLLDFVADDYELGARAAAARFRVVIAAAVVETHLPSYSFREFLQHQLRWARTIRQARPGDYRGFVVTYGLPWALLAWLFSGASFWALLLLLTALTARVAQASYINTRVLSDSRLRDELWLLPLRDCLGLVVWFLSYMGRRVWWRGEQFMLVGGKLHRVQAN